MPISFQALLSGLRVVQQLLKPKLAGFFLELCTGNPTQIWKTQFYKHSCTYHQYTINEWHVKKQGVGKEIIRILGFRSYRNTTTNKTDAMEKKRERLEKARQEKNKIQDQWAKRDCDVMLGTRQSLTQRMRSPQRHCWGLRNVRSRKTLEKENPSAIHHHQLQSSLRGKTSHKGTKYGRRWKGEWIVTNNSI